MFIPAVCLEPRCRRRENDGRSSGGAPAVRAAVGRLTPPGVGGARQSRLARSSGFGPYAKNLADDRYEAQASAGSRRQGLPSHFGPSEWCLPHNRFPAAEKVKPDRLVPILPKFPARPYGGYARVPRRPLDEGGEPRIARPTASRPAAILPRMCASGPTAACKGRAPFAKSSW